MLLTSVEYVSLVGSDDLGNASESPECRRVQYPIAVALKGIPLVVGGRAQAADLPILP
jgi:hypothetical protein